jgi:hypothetical protein
MSRSDRHSEKYVLSLLFVLLCLLFSSSSSFPLLTRRSHGGHEVDLLKLEMKSLKENLQQALAIANKQPNSNLLQEVCPVFLLSFFFIAILTLLEYATKRPYFKP